MEKQERAELFKSVYGVETTKEILEVFRADYKNIKNIEGTKSESLQKAINIFQRYLLAITFLYKVSSINNNLQAFKKVIKEEGGELEEYVSRAFHLGGGKGDTIPSIHKLLSAKTTKKIEEREANKDNMNFKVVSEIKRIKSLLDTKTYNVASNQDEDQVRSYHLAYILGLSTGRRFTELLKTVTIHSLKSGLFFRGILKKDLTGSKQIEANIIHLSETEVKGYLKELRTHLNTKLKTTKKKSLTATTENEINSIFSKVYNNAVKRISSDQVPNFHELRHHYTVTGTELFKREGESERETRYRILGHELKEDTTRTYATTK
jgi:predicted transcriptional regulator